MGIYFLCDSLAPAGSTLSDLSPAARVPEVCLPGAESASRQASASAILQTFWTTKSLIYAAARFILFLLSLKMKQVSFNLVSVEKILASLFSKVKDTVF